MPAPAPVLAPPLWCTNDGLPTGGSEWIAPNGLAIELVREADPPVRLPFAAPAKPNGSVKSAEGAVAFVKEEALGGNAFWCERGEGAVAEPTVGPAAKSSSRRSLLPVAPVRACCLGAESADSVAVPGISASTSVQKLYTFLWLSSWGAFFVPCRYSIQHSREQIIISKGGEVKVLARALLDLCVHEGSILVEDVFNGLSQLRE